MNLKLTLVVLLSSLAVIFLAQNGNVVEIAFLYWGVSVSSALLMFFLMTVGFLLGWFVHGYLLHQKAGNAKSVKSQ